MLRAGAVNPSMLLELAALATDAGESVSPDAIWLRRFDGLSDAGRRLLGLIALAAAPLPEEVFFWAADGGSSTLDALDELQRGHLLHPSLRRKEAKGWDRAFPPLAPHYPIKRGKGTERDLIMNLGEVRPCVSRSASR